MKLRQFILLLILGFAGNVALADPAENASATVILALQQGDLGRAEQLANQLTHNYPDFKMGHLLLAEVQSIKLGYNSQNLQLDNKTKQTLSDLRQETQVRWEHTLSPPPKNAIPSPLIKLGDSHDFAIIADAARSRLYVFSNHHGTPSLVADHYMGIGKGGFGKQKEGDMLTPLGVYKIESYIDGQKLPDLYGAGAYPINYPNPWDIINKRTGHGIWVHGVPVADYSRPPLSSEGCMTMNNGALRSLANIVKTGNTPVIITDKLDWLAPKAWQQQQRQLLATIDNWRRDWQSLDTARYLRHYSRDFRDGSKNYQAWREHKTRVNGYKKFIKVSLQDLSIFAYPGEPHSFVVTFTQNYQSSNINSIGRKSQIWRQQGDNWQIIYEGSPLI